MGILMQFQNGQDIEATTLDHVIFVGIQNILEHFAQQEMLCARSFCKGLSINSSPNSRSNKSFSNALHYTPTLSSILASSVPSLAASTVKVCVNNLFYLECLVDTGSSDSFINLSVVNQFKLKSILSESHGGSVNLAAGKQAASVYGSCRVSLDVFSEHH